MKETHLGTIFVTENEINSKLTTVEGKKALKEVFAAEVEVNAERHNDGDYFFGVKDKVNGGYAACAFSENFDEAVTETLKELKEEVKTYKIPHVCK